MKTKIIKKALQNLSDEEIDELIFNKASEKYFGTFGEYFENTDKDILLCQIFAISILDFEIRNGGFDQFFLNNEDLTEFAKDGLQKINANEHYNLLTDAIQIYTNQKEEFKNVRNTNLDLLDERYYELEDIKINRINFIIQNIQLFYD